jgi:uncharacterized OsmC-like protein
MKKRMLVTLATIGIVASCFAAGFTGVRNMKGKDIAEGDVPKHGPTPGQLVPSGVTGAQLVATVATVGTNTVLKNAIDITVTSTNDVTTFNAQTADLQATKDALASLIKLMQE